MRTREQQNRYNANARAARALQSDQRSLARWGCTREQYRTLAEDRSRPILRFTQHRRNAQLRGVAFTFLLWEWWCVWRDSGKWRERGPGDGYCMCRRGDVGAYAPGNVFIDETRRNSATAARKKRSPWPMGVQRTQAGNFKAMRRSNGKSVLLGTYRTPEEAGAAYAAQRKLPGHLVNRRDLYRG